MKTCFKALALVVLCLPLYGFEFYSKLKNEEGNRHYQKNRLGKAKSAYEKALRSSPGSNEIAFNLGNTYYKEGSFAESLKNFKNAAGRTSPPDLQAHAFYNIGNALYRQEDLNKAADFYKQTLRIDPADQDAKYNLELALRALEKKKDEPQNKDKKDQQKKEDQKQDPKDQNKDQNQDQNQGQEKQPKPDQGQGEQKAPQEDQSQDEPKKGEQEKQESEEQGDKEDKGAAEQEAEQEAGQETGQETGQEEKPVPKSDAEARAEQILTALESGEQQAMKMQGAQNARGPKVRRITEKDW